MPGSRSWDVTVNKIEANAGKRESAHMTEKLASDLRMSSEMTLCHLSSQKTCLLTLLLWRMLWSLSGFLHRMTEMATVAMMLQLSRAK